MDVCISLFCKIGLYSCHPGLYDPLFLGSKQLGSPCWRHILRKYPMLVLTGELQLTRGNVHLKIKEYSIMCKASFTNRWATTVIGSIFKNVWASSVLSSLHVLCWSGWWVADFHCPPFLGCFLFVCLCLWTRLDVDQASWELSLNPSSWQYIGKMSICRIKLNTINTCYQNTTSI